MKTTGEPGENFSMEICYVTKEKRASDRNFYQGHDAN